MMKYLLLCGGDLGAECASMLSQPGVGSLDAKAALLQADAMYKLAASIEEIKDMLASQVEAEIAGIKSEIGEMCARIVNEAESVVADASVASQEPQEGASAPQEGETPTEPENAPGEAKSEPEKTEEATPVNITVEVVDAPKPPKIASPRAKIQPIE